MTPPAVAPPRTPAPHRIVARAWRTVTGYHRTFLGAVLLVQVATAAVLSPAVVLLLRAALAAAGVRALTEASLGQLLRDPVAVLLLLLLAAVASAGLLVGQGVVVLLARDARTGSAPDLRRALRELAGVVRRLLGLQLLLFAGYAFVLVPLGNLEVAAFLTRGVELPPFIASELRKTPLGTAAWMTGLVTVLYVNVRLALTPAVLLTGSVGVAGALARSWRLTRRQSWRILVIVGGAWLASAAVLGGATVVALAVVRLGESLWPAAAPVVATAAVTGVQLLVLLVAATVIAVVTLSLLTLAAPHAGPAARPVAPRPAASAWSRVVVAVVVLGVVAVTTATSLAVVRGAERTGTTAVVAHRGVTDAAVENTLESLAAAAELGVDQVELDVQQSGDGGIVVVHDTNLRRIAGVDRAVPDMTTAELTATVVSQGGHRSRIPSFEEFAALAAELDVALLVELKTHGREHGDYLGDVAEVLRRHHLLAGSRLQSFDRAVVEDAADRFPDLTVGWVVAFYRGRLDPGDADFVALEQSSFAPRMLREAREAGVELFLWTVSDAAAVRQHTRAGVDGLITGSPAMALRERARVDSGTSLADRLTDELRGLAGWW